MAKCIWKVAPEDRLCRYCKLTHCEERVIENARRRGTVMPRMREMGVGQEIVFDASLYNACRTAASRLGSDWSVRIITRMESDGVHVERVS